MRDAKLKLSSQAFNMVWRGLHAHRDNLHEIIEREDEDNDAYIAAANDLVYLNSVIKYVDKKGKKAELWENAFELSMETINLADLI